MEMDEFRKYIKFKVDDIDAKVTIQNGRVGKLERWQAFTQGAVVIIMVLLVPIAVQVISTLLSDGINGG